MRAFYQRLFPYRHLFQWLNHGPQPCADFANREFAFTLPNDVYARYQAFQTADLYVKLVLIISFHLTLIFSSFRKSLISHIPTRFEIGPVYSTNPRDRKSLRRGAVLKPLAKELVLDIDMTDYDSIRTCCTGASICSKCWAWMRVAIKVLDSALREDFGWKHILWVYSGRRGVHAWVCDRSARSLDDRTRTAVATYLECIKGGDGKGKKVALRRPLHPLFERSLKTLRECFQIDILKGQDPWREDDRAAHLLSLLPDNTLVNALSKKWSSDPGRSSTAKWADIDELASDASNTSNTFDPKQLREAKQDIVLEYTYPRLDAAVSKHLNHLLKSPFCVHPKSGRICVPISPDEVDSFDPEKVPTVTELLRELGTRKSHTDEDGDQDMVSSGERKAAEWERTKLRPYVDYFRGFVGELIRDEQKQNAKRKLEDGTMDF